MHWLDVDKILLNKANVFKKKKIPHCLHYLVNYINITLNYIPNLHLEILYIVSAEIIRNLGLQMNNFPDTWWVCNNKIPCMTSFCLLFYI